MPHYQLKNSDGWYLSLVEGTDFRLIKGTVGSLADLKEHPRTSFSGKASVILGVASAKLAEKAEDTVAVWSIPTDVWSMPYFESGYLVVGCIRYFGGLHSKKYNSRVEIYINDVSIDGFGLRVKPPSHSDYFHRIPTPEIPKFLPISECQTLYSWSILKEHLSNKNEQMIKLKVDQYTRWDVDYIGLLYKADVKHKIFISHNWQDKKIARRLAKDLTARGVGVWLDERELKIGDSLIEKIREGIDNVEYLVVLLSHASAESPWVKKEVDIAMNQEIEGKRIKVLPILIEDCDPPGFLKGKLYADLRNTKNYSSVLSQIVERLKPAR